MKKIKDVLDLGINLLDKILVCMPHPDDEAEYLGGLLYKLAKLKIPTRVVTFTRGERGSRYYGLKDQKKLGQARSLELKRALSILNIENHKIYDCGDGQLVSRKNLIKKILYKEIKTFNPSHIITVEPNGIYGHSDHIALSKYVSEINDLNIKILYATGNPNYSFPEVASTRSKKTVAPIKPQFELQLNIYESILKFSSLMAHNSQNQINTRNMAIWKYFLKNNVLTKEYFTYKEDRNFST